MPYEYPPSSRMLSYGPLEEGTHYYCDGIAYAKSSWGAYNDAKRGQIHRHKCVFEVAYTRECEIFVVCYLSMDKSDIGKTKRPAVYDFPVSRIEKLIGRDVRFGLNVIVESLSLATSVRRAVTSPSISYSEFSMIYRAECFSVSIPAHRLETAINTEREIGKYDGNTFHFEITGYEFKKLEDHYFPVSTQGDKCLFTLKPERKHDEREYGNQTTGTLLIPESCIPAGWAAQDIADVWCALVSIALGRDIQWKSCYLPLCFEPHRQTITWKRRKIHGDEKFHGYLAVSQGNDLRSLQSCVSQAFDLVLNGKILLEHSRAYVYILRQYVYYLTIGLRDVEGNSRLVTTLTEEFLYTWVKFFQPQAEKVLTRDERSKLLTIITNVMEARKQEYLQSENLSNYQILIDRVRDLIKQEIRRETFVSKVHAFFDNQINRPNLKSNLADRIAAFIKTRDSIVHIGKLWHFNEEEYDPSELTEFYGGKNSAWELEYYNALMILPLMFLCIFGYQGTVREPDGWV